MSSNSSKVRKILTTPVRTLIYKYINKRKINKKYIQFEKTLKDKSTFINQNIYNNIPNSYFISPNPDSISNNKDAILFLSEKILTHEFNLLGSRLVLVKHGTDAPGIFDFLGNKLITFPIQSSFNDIQTFIRGKINKSNIEYSLNIASLIDEDYLPIDWQLDFKSGFRWNENTPSYKIEFGNVEGADIKMPWELGRMQHLPVLAYSYLLSNAGNIGFKPKEIYLEEFQNEVLDFICSNPPRFGVQQKSPMDLAIHSVNLLITIDLFKHSKVNFSADFEKIVTNHIYQSCLTIIENLEYSPDIRGNHYFANIAGLLFIASYLQSTPETDSILLFAINEIINETFFQFGDKGFNFEESVHYHIFSTEMLLWSLIIIAQLSEERFSGLNKVDKSLRFRNKPLRKLIGHDIVFKNGQTKFTDKFNEKLEAIIYFTEELIDSKGNTPNFGDMDSGRLLILTPWFKELSNKQYNYQYIKELINVICGNVKSSNKEVKYIEYNIINNDKLRNNDFIKNLKNFRTSNPTNVNKDLLDTDIPNFKTEYYSFFIKTENIKKEIKRGHAHNDSLSFVLSVKDIPVIVDPGTYNYTALPKIRNKYRSTELHNLPVINKWDKKSIISDNKDDLFWFYDTSRVIINSSEKHFTGERRLGNILYKREIIFENNTIFFEDTVEPSNGFYLNLHFSPEFSDLKQINSNQILTCYDNIEITIQVDSEIRIIKYFYCPEYGKAVPSNKVQLQSIKNSIKYSIAMNDFQD